MKTLVLGSNGQLGRALAETAPDGVEFVGLNQPSLDIRSADDVLKVCRDMQPAVIINTAAYTAVDQAESETGLAAAVNVDGPRNIATAAHEVGARLVHISTDFVFDGEASTPYEPHSKTHPVSIYGSTKRDGELAVLDAMSHSAVVLRSAWLYSRTGGNFVLTMLRLMGEREELSVVSDQRGTPTWTDSLAEAVWGFANRADLNGIYHWTDAGECSWHEFAVAIQEEALSLGLLHRSIPIRPIPTDAYPTTATRPRYSVLDCSATVADLDLQPAPWRVNLRRMLRGMQP